MNVKKPEKLDIYEFREFGTFHNFLSPDSERIGSEPLSFYRDILQMHAGNVNISFSCCEILPREFMIDTSEIHTYTSEGMIPLDSDIYMHVAPANNDDKPDLKKIRIFKVPQGTMVLLKPGVWHYGPFVDHGKKAHVLFILPERTYANDCKISRLPIDERIIIDCVVK